MIILPVITIALLSNAFKEMLDTSYEIEEFKVGYRISEDSIYKELLPEVQSLCSNNGVILQSFPQGDITELLQSNTVAVFVTIKDDNSYMVYQSNDKKREAAIIESILTGFFYLVNETRLLYSYETAQINFDIETLNSAKVTREVLKTEPIPSSTDYYGIIYIIYFAWCGMVSLVAVISSERKSAIPIRMRVSHMSKAKYYIGKFIPCTLAIYIEVGAAWILSVLLFDIHWGSIGMSTFILLLISMASSAFGILLFQMFQNVAISIVLGFVITWIAGFFGGSFQTYMYANLPQKLVNMSPIYYINRTLVEFSTKGYSDYTSRSLWVLIGIIIVCGVLGMLLMNREMEEQ
jgi:ABC-2 type transport system permease protein